MKIALIKQGKVENIIEAEEKFCQDNKMDYVVIGQLECSIGFIYNGEKFINPNPEIAIERTYVEKRCEEYPSIKEQLDILYHSGFEAWKQRIKAIKEKYPKEIK